MNPPAAAGVCGGAVGDCGVENCRPLAGAGSCFSDCSGSCCPGALPPWLENIFVNAPGSDGAADAGVPETTLNSSKGPGLDTWEGGGAGVGETGPELPGTLPPCAENMRVNSPGPDRAGAPDLGSVNCEGGGAGVGVTGPELPGTFDPWLENMRVNSPGAAPEAAGVTGDALVAAALGEEAGGACLGALGPIELNICVNAPGPDDPAGAGAPGPEFGTWETGAPSVFGAVPAVGIPTVGSTGDLSIATGVKTRFTSSVRPVLGAGLALEPAPLPGMISACSMRVNSPGLAEPCDGGAAG